MNNISETPHLLWESTLTKESRSLAVYYLKNVDLCEHEGKHSVVLLQESQESEVKAAVEQTAVFTDNITGLTLLRDVN